MLIRHLYISPGHNYFGHHGKLPGSHSTLSVSEIDCIAGRGLQGDRFCDYKENYRGQITFFASETYDLVSAILGIHDRTPAVFRRNVITEGADLAALIGKEFEIEGVQFRGTEECRPCYWMDSAFGPGTESLLRGRGGLRAQILTNGTLRAAVAPSAVEVSL